MHAVYGNYKGAYLYMKREKWLLNSVLLAFSVLIVTGCALSPEKIATKKAVGSYVDCTVSFAYDWRKTHPGKDTFSLFGLANRQCSAEYSNMERVTKELIVAEASKRGVRIAPLRINKEVGKILPDGRRSTFSIFEKVYLNETARTREEFKTYIANLQPKQSG
jgi:hypothetical protein